MNYTTVLKEIRKGILAEMIALTENRTKFIFRRWDEVEEEEKVYCDVAVSYPDETGGAYPDVFEVFQDNLGFLKITVKSAYGDEQTVLASEHFFETEDLATLLEYMNGTRKSNLLRVQQMTKRVCTE